MNTMTKRQLEIDEISRQLDWLSKQVERAVELWSSDRNKSKKLLAELSHKTHVVSMKLERLSDS